MVEYVVCWCYVGKKLNVESFVERSVILYGDSTPDPNTIGNNDCCVSMFIYNLKYVSFVCVCALFL